MAFESILNKPMTEPNLLSFLTTEVQKNYGLYQSTYFFMKFEYVGEKNSKVIWIKSFDSPKDFADFFYDTKFMRACMLLKFKNGRYEVLGMGFYYSDHFEVWPDKIMNSRPIEVAPYDYDNKPMPSRELIEGAFGEIAQALASSKSNIPV